MATLECKDCGGLVSTRVTQCPHCGAPIKKKSGCFAPALTLLFVIFVIVMISKAVNHDDQTTPTFSSAEDQNIPATNANAITPSTQSKTPVTNTLGPATAFVAPQRPPAPPETAPKPEPPNWDERVAELKVKFLPEFKAPPVGITVSLQLAGGSIQEGKLIRLTDKEIKIIRDTATIGFIPSQLTPATRIRFFAADYAIYQANKQMRVEKDAFYAEERARLAQIEATQKAARDAQLAVQKSQQEKQRQEQIDKGFSAWNGSHLELTKYIKTIMNDPKSYEHVKTTYSDQGDSLIVRATFRGKNAFGGVVVNWISAKCSIDGTIIEIIGQGP